MSGITPGQMCFYAGIIIAGASILAMIISIVIIERQKKRFLSNMDKETE